MISFKKLLTASLLLTAFLGFSAPLSAMKRKISLYDSIEQQALAEGEELKFGGQELTSDELGDFLRNKLTEAQREKTTILYIWCSNLTSLPADFATLLPNLRMLLIEANYLDQGSLLRIPSSILYLSLQASKVTELPAKFINQCPNLQILNLSDNPQLNPQTLLNIPPNIKELWAMNCKLSILPTGFAQHFTNLQRLELSMNNLTVDVFTHLPPNLRQLYLFNNDIQQITPKTLKELADSQVIVRIGFGKIDLQIQALRRAKRDNLVLRDANLKQRMADLRARNTAAKQNIQVLKDHINDKRNQLDNMLE